MTFQEICTIAHTLFPLSSVETDNHGQVIIYTGLKVPDESIDETEQELEIV